MEVSVTHAFPVSWLVLMDATGHEVLRLALTDTRMQPGTDRLATGLYGFRVIGPDGMATAHGSWVKE